MPPQRSSSSLAGASGEPVAGSPPRRALEGVRVPGPNRNGEEYQILEDWPRRGDAAGDVYRAAKRDGRGNGTIVALKVSRACGEGTVAASSVAHTAAARAWAQEVQLLRRLAMLGGQGGAGSCYTVELVDEFAGGGSKDHLRYLVTTPVCWKSLASRIKAVERGYQEKYDTQQAFRWCWQIARGLWALERADISFSALSLHHVLLTAPDGDVRLSGFDKVLGGEEEEEPGDSSNTHALGRVVHMTITCSTDREDDPGYYSARTAGPTMPTHADAMPAAGAGAALGAAVGAPRPFLAAIPPPARPVVAGLLATTPSYAMPLGLALEALAELVGVNGRADAALEAHRRTLRPVEEQWWVLVQQQGDAQAECGAAGHQEAKLALAKACLALGEEWERQRKSYRAAELYVDAAAFVGEAAPRSSSQPLRSQAGQVETEAWGRIADIKQGHGQHGAALRVLKRLVARYEAQARGALQSYREAQAQEREAREGGQQQQQQQQQQPQPDPAAWPAAVAGVQWVEAAERLAGARVRLAASLREVGEWEEALAHLNTAQRELQQAETAVMGTGGTAEGDGSGVAMVRVLTGKAAIYRQRGAFVQALEMYDSALELRRRVVPKEDPELAALLVGMAEVYAEKGDKDVALTLLVQAYKRMAEAPAAFSEAQVRAAHAAAGSGVGGEADCLLMSSTLKRIGRLFVQREQLDDALMCYRAAHERQSQHLARAHPAIADTLSAMADIHERKGDHRAAGQMHARALEVRRAVLSPTSAGVADSLYGLANAHQRRKDPQAALKAYEEAEAIRRMAASTGTTRAAAVALGDCLVNMSRPLKALHRDAEAVARLREAREVYVEQARLGADETRVAIVDDNLRVLSALAAAAAKQSGATGGDGSGPGLPGSVDRCERLLEHHARTTTSAAAANKPSGGAAAAGDGPSRRTGCIVS